MGLFDGIIGAETPVSNMDDSMTPPVGETTGSSGGTGDGGAIPVVTEQSTTTPLITLTDSGDGESLIIHSESDMENPVVPKGIMDFDISMPEVITKETQTTDTTSGISLIDEVSSEIQPVSDMIAL